jgi:hypothetical protein
MHRIVMTCAGAAALLMAAAFTPPLARAGEGAQTASFAQPARYVCGWARRCWTIGYGYYYRPYYTYRTYPYYGLYYRP